MLKIEVKYFIVCFFVLVKHKVIFKLAIEY